MAATQTQVIEVFFSYTHADQKLRDKLANQLSALQNEGVIQQWHDRKILAGANWSDEINAHLNNAQIILLLVSADFIASDYCYKKETARALERHNNGEAQVIPIILRPCDWTHLPIGQLQALPTDAKPVTSWSNQDKAFLNIAKCIRKIVAKLRTEQS